MNKLIEFLKGWGLVTQALEATLVDNIAATIPWLAPIIPAWFAYHSMAVVLGMPQAISLMGAAVIEFLGLATVSTTFKLWQFNDSRGKSQAAAPVQVAIGTTAFYLVIVLTVNVMLDDAPAVERAAKALLSMLSVAGAVTLAIRAQHARRLEAIAAERQERREMRRERQAATYGEMPQVAATRHKSPQVATSLIADWRALSVTEREQIAGMTTEAVMAAYPVSARTAREWREKSRNNGWHETVRN